MSAPAANFSLVIHRTSWKTFRLLSFLALEGMSPEQVFPFFENPRNLFTITPPWLDFRMLDPDASEAGEGAEYDYTIRWVGMKIPWKSRIVNYHPPREFTDIQIRGPYLRWEHRHTFERQDGGTRMRDQVDYELPVPALALHRILIRRQLEKIFRFRAMRIGEWARGELIHRGP